MRIDSLPQLRVDMLVHHCVQGTSHSVPSSVEKVTAPPDEATSKRTVLAREKQWLSSNITYKYVC